MSKLKFPHPGEILRKEFLDQLNPSQYRLAVDIGMVANSTCLINKQVPGYSSKLAKLPNPDALSRLAEALAGFIPDQHSDQT